jgi:tetratricopeptide (TPR) repeat protein
MYNHYLNFLSRWMEERFYRRLSNFKISHLVFLSFMVILSPVIGGCQDLSSGVDAYEKGDYDKAIQVLEEYLKGKPEDVEARYFLGNSYLEKGQLDKAQEEYEKVLDRDSKHPLAIYHLGLVHVRKKEFEEAKKLFERGLKLKKEEGLFHNGMGLIQMEKGDLTQADLSFRLALGADPENPEFHKNLGDLYMKKEVMPLAIDAYHEALGLDSTMAEVHYSLGEAHFLNRDFNSAVDEFRAAINLNPEYRVAYLRLGDMYMIDRKHFAQAAAMYEEYVTYDEKNDHAYLSLGKAYFYLRELEKAIENLERAKELEPNDQETYHFLGMAYQDTKNLEQALKAYDQYVEIRQKEDPDSWNGKDAEFWMRKGRVHLALGDSTNLALGSDALNKAVELDSTMISAFASLGYTYYKQEKYEEAIPLFLKKIELDTSNNFNPLVYLAYAYIGLEEYSKAVDPLLKALELQPDNADVRKTLARVHFSQEMYTEAVEQYRLILQDDPDNCEMVAAFGYSLMRLERPAQAISPLSRAVRCYPNDISYMLLLAQALELRKNLDEAYKWYMEVLKRDPKNQAATLGRDRIDMQRF